MRIVASACLVIAIFWLLGDIDIKTILVMCAVFLCMFFLIILVLFFVEQHRDRKAREAQARNSQRPTLIEP